MARRPANSSPPPAPAKAPASPIEQRVSDLECLVATALVTPTHEGRPLVHCVTCRMLATRQHRFEHPHCATFYQVACDDCDLKHPLIGDGASVVTTEPIPFYPEGAVEIARKINAVRKAVLARVAP